MVRVIIVLVCGLVVAVGPACARDKADSDFLSGVFAPAADIVRCVLRLSEREKNIMREEIGGTSDGGRNFVVFVGPGRDGRLRYCFVIGEEGKHGLIIFAVVLSPRGVIEDVIVLNTSEVRGKKINRRRFLRQFIGKGYRARLRLGRDIDAVTGATVSSLAAARAVRRVLLLWRFKGANIIKPD